jgi:flagellar basal-body rod modification protein FlgD
MTDFSNNPFARLGMPIQGGPGSSQRPQNGNDEMGADAFMRLMITQMQNQDPTKPMEAEQFLGQLAQFSSVTGLQELKSSFDNLAASMVSNQALQGANLVGRSVLVPSEVGYHDGEQGISGMVDVDAISADVNIGIYNAQGELVRQLPTLTTGDGRVRFNWDGMDDEGNALPAGQYEIRAQSISGGRAVANEILTRGAVESVRFGRPGQPLELNLQGLGVVGLDQVRQIG